MRTDRFLELRLTWQFTRLDNASMLKRNKSKKTKSHLVSRSPDISYEAFYKFIKTFFVSFYFSRKVWRHTSHKKLFWESQSEPQTMTALTCVTSRIDPMCFSLVAGVAFNAQPKSVWMLLFHMLFLLFSFDSWKSKTVLIVSTIDDFEWT